MSAVIPTQPRRVLLAVTAASFPAIEQWSRAAAALGDPGSTVLLRGMIVIPDDKSLSEGTLDARLFREALEQMSPDAPVDADQSKVYVDHQPFVRILDELRTLQVDVLVAEWVGPSSLTGGLTTESILESAPCDVVLLSGPAWHGNAPVLLSLRGGPNITLGVRVSKALAGEAPVTLFHAADQTTALPNLNRVIHGLPFIKRTVTVVDRIADGVLRELDWHKAVVLGASIQQPTAANDSQLSTVRSIYERTAKPVVLVRAFRPEDLAFHPPRLLPAPQQTLSTRVDRWFAENTFHSSEFADIARLMTLKEKQGVTISLGLPALNEEKTVERVISSIQQALMHDFPLVDEIVLIDSNSTDRTLAIAEGCGIPAYRHPDILAHEVGTYVGKGEALWKSLFVLKGDLIAWIDTDITNIHPRFVYGLLGPLLKRPDIHYVKGFYQRPIKVGNQLQANGGGRVTELVARPLLNLFYPELSGIIQPLSGEYAGRRKALECVPFFTGYGVETGLLLDLHEREGLDGIAQVDLEERIHHNQPLVSLSKMSFAIHQVFVSRLERRYGIDLLEKANRSMKLIVQEPERFALDSADITDVERPPMLFLPAYSAKFHG
jgi:glucosyl-3-phosphoglycerate synthase